MCKTELKIVLTSFTERVLNKYLSAESMLKKIIVILWSELQERVYQKPLTWSLASD